MSDEQPKNIHEAIVRIMENVGYVQKKKGANLNYTYAGEAALIEAIRPYMVEFGVYCYVLDVSNETFESYETQKGAQMNMARLRMTIRFVHAPSGTFIDVVSRGQGADSGDKSDNKASTGAYKYGLRQTFCIETGDDPDDSPSEGAKKTTGDLAKKDQATKKPTEQPAVIWYENALATVKANSAIYDKSLGATPQGNAFIKKILETHVGEGRWYLTKADYIEAVKRYTGFATPEEMSWRDAEVLIRIATNQRVVAGKPLATIVYQGILTDTEWTAICESSKITGSSLIEQAERDDLILWLKGAELMGQPKDIQLLADNLVKIVKTYDPHPANS